MSALGTLRRLLAHASGTECHYRIEPLIYKDILLPLDVRPARGALRKKQNKNVQLKSTMTTKSPTFFARNVKNLTAKVSSHFQGMENVLRVCTGISSLGIWYYHDLRASPELITPLPLRRFTTDIEQFLAMPVLPSDPSCQWHRALNHLELDVSAVSPFTIPDLAYDQFADFTHLTHLGFFALSLSRVRMLARAALEECENLEVLFVALKWEFSEEEIMRTDGDWVSDPRVVVMKMKPSPLGHDQTKSWEDDVWMTKARELVSNGRKVLTMLSFLREVTYHCDRSGKSRARISLFSRSRWRGTS